MHVSLLLAAFLAPALPPPPTSPSLTIDAVLHELAEKNPSIAEARELASAAHARARADGALPAPMVSAQTWDAPLERPWSTSEAAMTMYGVEQTIPAGFFARRSGFDADADRADEALAATRARVVRDARVAFHEYWRAWREAATHRDHVDLATQVLGLIESRYASGSGRQHEVLRARLALSQRHLAVHGAGADLAAARASLVALLSRTDPDLAQPVIAQLPPIVPDLRALEPGLPERRPEIRAAADALRAAQSRRSAARARAWIPDVSVGATWMDMNMGEDRSMAMVALELPWGWGGRRASAHAATREIAAAEAAQRAVADGALAELRGAHARAVSSREVLALHETDILPSAQRTADSVRAAWVAGEASLADLLDSLDAQLASRIEADAARARLEAALADLDRAAGVDPLSTAGDR